MILATDVHYADTTALAAGVMFRDWDASWPIEEYVSKIDKIEPYQSGQFYKRELPCILSLLDEHGLDVDCIVIDGFVYLDNNGRAGLGKHLFDALDERVLAVGVAKNHFPGVDKRYQVFRGKSQSPLYVSTTGDLSDAKKNVLSMAGEFRFPALLKRVDQLCRGDRFS